MNKTVMWTLFYSSLVVAMDDGSKNNSLLENLLEKGDKMEGELVSVFAELKRLRKEGASDEKIEQITLKIETLAAEIDKHMWAERQAIFDLSREERERYRREY